MVSPLIIGDCIKVIIGVYHGRMETQQEEEGARGDPAPASVPTAVSGAWHCQTGPR